VFPYESIKIPLGSQTVRGRSVYAIETLGIPIWTGHNGPIEGDDSTSALSGHSPNLMKVAALTSYVVA